MKAHSSVPVVAVAATVLIAATTKMWSATVCGSAAHIPTSPACCDRSDATDPSSVAPGPTDAFAAEEMKSTLRVNQGLLTSFATDLKEPVPKVEVDVQLRRTNGSSTNGFAGMGVLAADTPDRMANTRLLDLSRQGEFVTGTPDLLSVPRDWIPRGDALVSGSRRGGLSFAFSRSARSARGRLLADAKVDELTSERRDRADADSGRFAKGRIWGRDDARIEPLGLRLFIWRW